MDRGTAERAVAVIVADIRDRRGLKHEWDAIDADVQAEIRETWVQVLLAAEAAGPGYAEGAEHAASRAAADLAGAGA